MGKIVMLAGLIGAIWVIYDVWENQKQMHKAHKWLWTVSAVLFNVLTAILYLLVIAHARTSDDQ